MRQALGVVGYALSRIEMIMRIVLTGSRHLQAGPHPDASRAQPVFTACRLCTAGRHQHPAAPSRCDRLLNPQTTQLPPATRPSALPIGCTRPAAGPQQPQECPSRLPDGEPHQGRPAGLPQAAPGPIQGQRRGVWGEPCPHALGGRHHIARPEIDPKRADGRGMGKARAVLWAPPAVEEGPR